MKRKHKPTRMYDEFIYEGEWKSKQIQKRQATKPPVGLGVKSKLQYSKNISRQRITSYHDF